MCRNIKKLRQPNRMPTDQELELAALQFIRKVSGYQKPSRANEDAFAKAVKAVASSTRTLFEEMVVRNEPSPESGS